MTPAGLIPWRFDQPPAIHGVADTQRCRVATVKPPTLGPSEPLPCGPEHRHQQALHVARRNVDEQIPYLTAADCLQVLDDRIDVPAGDERRRWFHDQPSLAHELG